MKELHALSAKIEKMYNTQRTFEDRDNLRAAVNDLITQAEAAGPENSDPVRPLLVNGYRLRVELYPSDDYEAALKDLDKIIQLCPYEAAAYRDKACLMARRPRSTELIHELIALHDHSIRLDMAENPSYFHRGGEKAALGDYPGAIADFDVCIKHDIISWRAHFERGRCKMELGEYYEAIHNFNMVLYHVKHFPEAVEARAKAKFKINDYEGAAKDCVQILHENPQNYPMWHLLGDMQLEMGQTNNALSSYKQIIKHGTRYFDLEAVKEKVANLQTPTQEK